MVFLLLVQLVLVSPSAAADDAVPTIQIEAISPEILTDESTVEVTARVSNFGSDDATGSIRLSVLIQADPLLSIDAVREFLDGRGTYGWEAGEVSLTEAQLKDAATDTGALVKISMKAEDLPLWNENAWGPYGVEVRAFSSADTFAMPQDHSLLLWYPPGAQGEVALNFLLPGSAQPGALAALLQHARDGVTLALTPPQVKALSSGPQEDSVEAVVLPAQRADLSMLASLDQMALYKIASASRYAPVEKENEGEEQDSENAQSRSTKGDDSNALLVEGVIVVSDGWMSRAVLQTAGEDAVLSPPNGLALTATPSSTPSSKTRVSATDGSTVAAALPQPDAVTVIDSWSELGELFSPSSADASALDLRQEIRAITSFVATDEEPDKRYLWVNLPSTADATALEERLGAALDAPWVEPVTLQQILDGPTSVVPRVPVEDATHGDFRVISDLMKKLDAAVCLAQSVVGASLDSSDILDEETATILYPTAAGISLDERTVRVKESVETLNDKFDIIEVAPTRTVNVMNSDADFPVTLSNRGEFPVTVEVALETSDVRLQSNQWVEVTVPTKGSIIAQIPVAAVGSGDVSARVVARTPDGMILDASQEIDVRVRAGLEDALTWIVAGIVGILFVIGLVRTLRKGRRPADQQRVRGKKKRARKSVTT